MALRIIANFFSDADKFADVIFHYLKSLIVIRIFEKFYN